MSRRYASSQGHGNSIAHDNRGRGAITALLMQSLCIQYSEEYACNDTAKIAEAFHSLLCNMHKNKNIAMKDMCISR